MADNETKPSQIDLEELDKGQACGKLYRGLFEIKQYFANKESLPTKESTKRQKNKTKYFRDIVTKPKTF